MNHNILKSLKLLFGQALRTLKTGAVHFITSAFQNVLGPHQKICYKGPDAREGRVAEWLKALAWKAGNGASRS